MKKPKLWCALYDVHFPQYDRKTLKAILSFIKQNHVDGLLLGGDAHPRILIADDHAIFAETLRTYLDAKTLTVIGVVADGRAMLQEAIRLRPDVVVADISMPLLNGLDAARTIREEAPKVAFVFLTMLDDANLAAAALELGHVAYVLKCCGGGELLKAIEETLHGRSYLTPRLRAEDWVAAKARVRQFSKDRRTARLHAPLCRR